MCAFDVVRNSSIVADWHFSDECCRVIRDIVTYSRSIPKYVIRLLVDSSRSMTNEKQIEFKFFISEELRLGPTIDLLLVHERQAPKDEDLNHQSCHDRVNVSCVRSHSFYESRGNMR